MVTTGKLIPLFTCTLCLLLGIFFPSQPRQERLWSPPSLLSNGKQGLFSWGYSGRNCSFTSI